MRKYILSVLTFFGLFVLSGCGGGSGSDNISNTDPVEPGTGNPAVEIKLTEMIITGDTFVLPVSFIKKIDTSYKVELSNFSLTTDSCTLKQTDFLPDPLLLNGGTGSVGTVNVTGTFDQNCTATKYIFSATQKTTKDGKVDTRMFSVEYDSNNPDGGGGVTPAPSSGFFNATTPLVVTQADTAYEIKVQMIEDGYVASGKIVKMKPFDSQFGAVSSYQESTATDGYALFSYTSPSTLPANGTSAILELTHDDNGTIISQNIVLHFNSDGNIPIDPLAPPKVVVPNDKKENTLTVNNELVELAIKVFNGENNAPYSEGKVKVELPIKVTTGVDVGSFEAYEVDIVNGVAVFKYSGPNDLQSLIDNGDTESIFQFYHEDNYADKQPAKMIYNPGSSYIPSNYIMTISSDDSKFTMGLLSVKTFSIILKNDQGSEVADADITSVVITNQNTLIAKLLDSNGNEGNILTVLRQNPVNFSVETNTKSGLLPIEITIRFVDANGDAKVLMQTINMVVFSGPPTAMSISYAGVSQDTARAKYVEKFAITAVDTYNNKVNTQPNISIGGIVEYAVDGSSRDGIRRETSPRLWYGKNDSPYGTVRKPLIAGDQATFDTAGLGDIFQYVDFFNDKLVVFGEGYVYEALGKWDISSGTDLNSLTLLDDYFGIDRPNLFYAVGHNYRLDLCSNDGREYVGAAESDTYQLDPEGTALVSFMYDYQLAGKDIMLWVNLSGQQADTNTITRIGEARKHTLRGNGLVTPHTYTLPKFSGAQPLYFRIEHENAPEHYKNAHFAYTVTGKCSVNNVISSSNFVYDANGAVTAVKDARSCDNRGIVYVELNVSNPTGSDCTITLDNILISGEF